MGINNITSFVTISLAPALCSPTLQSSSLHSDFSSELSTDVVLDCPSVELFVPVEIFSSPLSSLESLVKYLVENEHLSTQEIALLLERDYKTIWGAYNQAKQKFVGKASIPPDSVAMVPITIFTDRSFGVLEQLSLYLREEYGMRYSQIGKILNLDQRTIWVSCDRAKKKRVRNASGMKTK